MSRMTETARATLAGWIERRMAHDQTPAVSLAVCDRDGIVGTLALGLADLAAVTPVTPDHLFEIGSIGKSFTAVALLQLADEGKVDLQAPVTDYLPWFEVRTEHEPIRLHHLLTHTAGITSGIDFAPTGTIQVWAMRDEVAATPPGTHFHYSNLGYKVLGEVLRAVTGDEYGATIRSRILDPLGLTGAAATITNQVRPRLAVGYGRLSDDRPWRPGLRLAPATWLETDTADGCLAMTASDLATYLRMLLGRGELDGRRVLSELGFERLTRRVIATEDPPDDAWYGYGLFTVVHEGRVRLLHPGGMVGYSAAMIGDLDSGLGVVALVNGPGAPYWIAWNTLSLLVAEAEGTPFELPAIPDPTRVEAAGRLVGEYTAAEGHDGPPAVRIDGNAAGLTVSTDDGTGRLLSYYGDLHAEHPAFDRFTVGVEDDEGDAPAVLTYGDTTYVRVGEDPPPSRDYPAAWDAFPGHYRSHNPWTPSLRVRLRGGRLWLVFSEEPDGFELEQPLVPLADGWFRAGDDERIPERIRFDTPIDGETHVARVGGCDFYRVSGP